MAQSVVQKGCEVDIRGEGEHHGTHDDRRHEHDGHADDAADDDAEHLPIARNPNVHWAPCAVRVLVVALIVIVHLSITAPRAFTMTL